MMLTGLDWTIVIVSIVALTLFSLRTVKYMRGVADFLSANRSAGRYLLVMAGSATGLGAISAVAYFEQFYAAGMPTIWWTWLTIPAGVILTLTGWVIYRFRETRCLTLAQFFEMRYSRNFRIYAGITVWISGILNFGIFPYVASNFFVYFCGLPAKLTLFSDVVIPTYWPIMLLTMGMALTYTVIGGHITVMITDCLQGIVVSAGLVILCLFLLSQYAWPDMVEAMQDAPVIAAREDLQINAQVKQLAYENAMAQGMTEVATELQQEREDLLLAANDDAKLREEAKGRSMLNPFDTGRVEHFSLIFFLILVFNQFYGMMSWQGSQAYQSSGITPHEQKMQGVIFPWVYAIRLVGLVLLSIAALTFLTHPNFLEQSAEARLALEQLRNSDVPQLAVQQRVPVALSYMLPTGLRGFFCVIMVFLLITTQDTYMHSWGSIFIQDVVMPFRKKPLTPKQHVNWLRWSIVGVAAFAFVFACLYKPTEFIQMYFAITGAIVSGLGCAIVGGLYWRYGGTAAAYVALSLGTVLSITRIVVHQYKTAIAAIPDKGIILRFVDYQNNINSQVIWFWIMMICISSYVVLSLAARRKPFNLDRMLHRGEYDVQQEHKKASDSIRVTWLKVIGITEEFTRTDRLLALALVAWNAIWIVLFFGAAIYHFLVAEITMHWWTTFWMLWIYLQVIVGVFATIWFALGGLRDMRRVFARLATLQRDQQDDGMIVPPHSAEEGDTTKTDDPTSQGSS